MNNNVKIESRICFMTDVLNEYVRQNYKEGHNGLRWKY